MSVEASQRCPRCGNENPADSYACSFCGKRLRVERVEKFLLLTRIEAEWTNPLPWYMKIIYLFIRPNLSFWDINHKRGKAPGYLILLFNSLLWGLMGLAVFSHFRVTSIGGVSVDIFSPLMFYYNLTFFLAFFLFGGIFQFILFGILVWLFTKGANLAVGFSQRLEARFGEEKAEEEESEKYSKENLSVFSIYKGGILLQRMEAYKFKMMLCAFAPFLLINGVKILILLIALPTVNITIYSGFPSPSIFGPMFNSPVWAVLDVIDALTIAIWVPLLMTIAMRELSNSSTFRLLIPLYIIGIIVAILLFFFRPTLFG